MKKRRKERDFLVTANESGRVWIPKALLKELGFRPKAELKICYKVVDRAEGIIQLLEERDVEIPDVFLEEIRKLRKEYNRFYRKNLSENDFLVLLMEKGAKSLEKRYGL